MRQPLHRLMFVAATLVFGGCATAQPLNAGDYIGPFYGDMTAAQKQEVREWNLAFWNRIDTGDPQTLTLTEPVWQSPLFNPLRATRATLERLKVLDPADCDWAIITATEGSPLWEKREALRESMTDGKFETDPVTNPEGYFIHMQDIFNAPPGTGVDAWIIDGKLVSVNLPTDVRVAIVPDTCATISGPIDCAAYQSQYSGESLTRAFALLNVITTTLPAFANQCTAVTEGQKLITDAESRADQVERRVNEIMVEQGFRPVTFRFDAAFGVYGSIPVIQVDVKDYSILIDGWSGRSSGLRPAGNILELSNLTSAYWEVDADRPFYKTFRTESGCQALFALAWTPYVIQPGDTLTPLPALPPSTLPGRPTAPICTHNAVTGICTCVTERVFMITPCPPGAPSFGAAGCRVVERTTCTWTVSAAGCTASRPNWPGQAPATGWPTPGATCTSEYGWR
jgi:hypothetical protein